MEKQNILKTKKVTALFAIVALIAGFLFLNPSITGGFVLENSNALNPVSLIGLVLITCEIILAVYSIKKK